MEHKTPVVFHQKPCVSEFYWVNIVGNRIIIYWKDFTVSDWLYTSRLMPYYQDAIPYKGNIPLHDFILPQFIDSSNSSSSAAGPSWPKGTQENDRVPVYPMIITGRNKCNSPKKRKYCLFLRSIWRKNIYITKLCRETKKYFEEILPGGNGLLRTIKFFWVNNKNVLTTVSVSPAWRLDREMRRRLILQETWFTR